MKRATYYLAGLVIFISVLFTPLASKSADNITAGSTPVNDQQEKDERDAIIKARLSKLDFSTPTKATEILIRAARNADVSLWYECLSRIEKEEFAAGLGEMKKAELLKWKKFNEEETGKVLGKDIYEYALGELIIDLSKGQFGGENILYNPYDMAFVRAEYIWDNKYAETVLILPLLVHGGCPPLRLSFINEDGKWKLLMSLSFLSVMEAENETDKNDMVDFFLDLIAGIKIDRGNDKMLKKKEFRISDELSAKYKEAWDKTPNETKDYLWFFWRCTGDREAVMIKPNNKSGFGEMDKIYEKFSKTLLSDGTDVKPLTTDELLKETNRKVEEPLDEAQISFIKMEHYNIRSYGKFIEKYKSDKKWCARAQNNIARLNESERDYDRAAEEYQKTIDKYPESSDEVIEAKTRLAKICWENINRQDEAMKLWGELDKAGKLPGDAQYKRGKKAVPRTLLQVKESDYLSKGYVLNMEDFCLDENGNINVLFYQSPPRSTRHPNPVNEILTSVNLYNSDGQLLKTLFSQKLKRECTKIFAGNGKVYIGELGEYFVIDKDKGIDGEIVDAADKILIADKPYSGIERTNSPANFYLFADSQIYALYSNKIIIFKGGTGELLRKIDLDCSEAGGIAKNSKNELIFICPDAGQVTKIDVKGQYVKFNGPEIPPTVFGHIGDVCCDEENNVYLLDNNNKRILKFDKNGKFIMKYSHPSITEPTSFTIDRAGNIYVVGYGFHGGEAVTILDKNNNLKQVVNCPTYAAGMKNGNILDLEVVGTYIYLVSDRFVMKYGFDGKRVACYDTTNDERPITLAKDRKDNIYFSNGPKIYQYDGGNPKEFMALNEKGTIQRIIANPGEGSIWYLYGYGLYEWNSADKRAIKTDVKLKQCGLTENFAVDSEDNIWIVMDNSTYGQSIVKINRSGNMITSIGELKKYTTRIEEINMTSKKAWKPIDVTVDRGDNIYVADGANNEIIKFSPDCKLLSEAEMNSYKINVFHIKIDMKNNLYILEDNNDSKRLVSFRLDELFGE